MGDCGGEGMAVVCCGLWALSSEPDGPEVEVDREPLSQHNVMAAGGI